jgi:YfiH family protein
MPKNQRSSLPRLMQPDWDVPVGAAMSTRDGGVSKPPWQSLNLGLAVGDDPAAVAENRRRLAAAAGVDRVVWLRQVHGRDVVHATTADATGAAPPADAVWTTEHVLALAIQVADCLPVLFATPDGSGVAAAHAGWRGLAAGVLDSAVGALCEGTGCAPERLAAWLGPCIGPTRFEVGVDVLHAFGAGAGAAHPHFRPAPASADGAPRWWADLPALARSRLHDLGLRRIGGVDACTVSDPSRWFSYRRDGVTGRLAALVWRRPDGA